MVMFLVLWPVASQAAWRWLWQIKSQASQTQTVDESSLKSGQAKVESWQKLVDDKLAVQGQKISVEFTAEELTVLVNEALGKLKNQPLEAGSFSVVLSEDKITVKGLADKFIRFSVQAEIIPKVVQGKLEPEIISAKLGFFKIGSYFIQRIADKLWGGSWHGALNPGNFTWSEIKVSEGKVYVAGEITKQN